MMKLFIKNSILLGVLTLLFTACSKEVEVDIPGFKEQLVVEGSIEPGMPPIVLLSKSKDIYSPTNLDAFFDGFVTDAQVFVSNGSVDVQLELFCMNDLPPGTENLVGQILGIDPSLVVDYNICAYTSLNPAIWGEVGKNYHLKIVHEGKEYTSMTTILNPHPLVNLWFEEVPSTPGYGFSHARLQDQAGIFDAYRWEVMRINNVNGETKDPYFKPTFNDVFNDEFFDGKLFDFYYENPWNFDDESIPNEARGRFAVGDTVVVKFSKVDKGVYDFLYTKTMQAMTNGNPFATPINVKSNITGGAYGLWGSFSPIYDTLICQ